MPSFDIVSELDKHELQNAMDNAAKELERWREQKKRYSLIQIEFAYLRQDGKRRVIQNDAIGWIIKVFIVAARVKWPDDALRIDAIFAARP